MCADIFLSPLLFFTMSPLLLGSEETSTTLAGYSISLSYNISMVLAPITGGFLDVYGFRGFVTLLGAFLHLVLFGALR